MNWYVESRKVRASEPVKGGISGATSRDRHGHSVDQDSLLPDYDGSDWTDEEAEVKQAPKPRVRGRMKRINRRGVCGGCFIYIQAIGDCQNCN